MLDRQAEARGVSRSDIIREAIERHLKPELDAQISRQIIADDERIPQATPDSWGNPADQIASGTRGMFHRLEEEERQNGQRPW